jgi:retinol dehydrogenase-14
VTVNAAHPGLVRSGFGGNNPATPSLAIFNLMGKLFGRTPEKGAETAIYLATSPEVEGVTGGYYADCREAVPSEAARDEAAARRLWEVSESLAWPAR